MKRIVEVSVYVVVILVGIIEIYSHVGRYIHDRKTFVHAGTQLPAFEGAPWPNHDRTLLLALQVGCHYCQESMPFYQSLSRMNNDHQTNVFMTAVFPNDALTANTEMRVFNLEFPFVPRIGLERLKVSGTPTLLLVDRSGVVKHVWVGKLSSGEEQEVKRAIQSTNQSALPPIRSPRQAAPMG